MANLNSPQPAGEISSLSASLSNAQEILRSKIQALEERVASVSRPPAPATVTSSTEAARKVPSTNHGQWLSDMVANADMMANHVQNIIDRIEL